MIALLYPEYTQPNFSSFTALCIPTPLLPDFDFNAAMKRAGV